VSDRSSGELRLTDDRTDVAASVADLLGLANDPLVFFAVLVAVALTAYSVIRFLLVPLLNRLMERSATSWDDILVAKGALFWLALLGPALILYFGAGYAPQHSEIWRRIVLALIVIIGTGVVDRLLSAALEIYGLYPFSRERPIKALIQIFKLAVYVAAAMAVVAVLAGTSPLTVLGGVTAITAVLLVVFKDTLLSLIANIQLYANDLVRQGDWIQVHDFGADGIVSEISLHTVKVRNWDNTIVTVPTCKLADGSFQNWRSMSESGGRRIRRGLLIDQTSVRFCDREMLDRFWCIRRLRPHLESKQKELESANAPSNCEDATQSPLNSRRLTNLGTFRAYVVAYLNESPHLHDDMTVMVRQRPPTPNGIPLEVYVFSKVTSFVEYEGVQADIFDHLLAALPYFDLRLFQYPTGENLQALKKWLEAETTA
jgi:miniconductance mechanosensitive channel